MIELHSSFSLKSHDNLHGKIGLILNCLVSLSTAEWRGHLVLLGQFQKVIELLELLLKKALRSWEIAMDCSWYGWEDESKMYLVAWMASVMTMIHSMLGTCTAWFIPHLIENSSASVEVTLTAWWIALAKKHVIMKLWHYSWCWHRKWWEWYLDSRSCQGFYQVSKGVHSWLQCLYSSLYEKRNN